MILLTGASGMLGRAVQVELRNSNIDYISLDIKGTDDYEGSISDNELLKTVFMDNQIECIINCAAWTDVDGAEEINNKDEVDKCNIIGVENLCNFAKQYNSKMIHISTDYVFNGQGNSPWSEDDIPNNPINYYGYTKLQAEKLVHNLDKYFIVRTQWTYGRCGKNFVDTMIRIARNKNEVKVVNDQFGSPTCVDDLAKVIVEMIQSDKYGYYHVVCGGDYITWYEFCCEIYRILDIKTKVTPISSKEYNMSNAKRPHNSRLKRDKYVNSGFKALPEWKVCLSNYLNSVYKNTL